MNPIGMRPERILEHQLNPIRDGKALQFIDQPDREIKCYTAAQAALGKGVPLYENGCVYHVKMKDLAEALGLNEATATNEDLNTELIWHMVHSASPDYRNSQTTASGAKEYLIGKYYLSQESTAEAMKWMRISSKKGYLPAELAVAIELPRLTPKQRTALKGLSDLVDLSMKNDPEQFVSASDMNPKKRSTSKYEF